MQLILARLPRARPMMSCRIVVDAMFDDVMWHMMSCGWSAPLMVDSFRPRF